MFVDTGFRLGCFYEPPLPENGAAYMRYLSRMLKSPPQLLSNGVGVDGQALYDETDLDLLLYWEQEQPWWQRWLGWTPTIRVVERSQASVLVVRQPLRRILLILRADVTDEAAIQWLGQLARSVRVELFVLPIIPPTPAMYRHGNVPLQAEVVLASNTFSGSQLRRLASLCAGWGVEGKLLLHGSEPQRRIEWASRISDCDLILLSHEPHHWLTTAY